MPTLDLITPTKPRRVGKLQFASLAQTEIPLKKEADVWIHIERAGAFNPKIFMHRHLPRRVSGHSLKKSEG